MALHTTAFTWSQWLTACLRLARLPGSELYVRCQISKVKLRSTPEVTEDERKAGLSSLPSPCLRMANPASGLSVHLTDRALNPIISSSGPPSSNNHNTQSQTQAQALSSLTTAAIAAYDTASRLGLGLPQRIMIETQSSGPIILHSYLNPPSLQRAPTSYLENHEVVRDIVEQAREDLRPLSGTTDTESMGEHGESSEVLVNGVSGAEGTESAEESNVQPPPILIASVVAPTAADAVAARRAAARLEQTGREFQRAWVREQEESHAVLADGEDG
jgi:hypothetical protein